MIKINYKDKKWDCCFWDAIEINVYIFRLRLRRTTRRMKVIFSRKDMYLYILLFVAWAMFSIIVYYFENRINEENTFIQILWSLKESIFTSFLLAIVVTAFKNGAQYKKNIRRQHRMYVDAMDDFEAFLWKPYENNIWACFHALYNERCFRQSMTYFDDENYLESLEFDNVLCKLNNAKSRIVELQEDVREDRYVVEDNELLRISLNKTKALLEEIKALDKEKIKYLFVDFYCICNLLRYPWRRDCDLDMKILNILNRYTDNNIEEDYYLRMFLDTFDIKCLLNCN